MMNIKKSGISLALLLFVLGTLLACESASSELNNDSKQLSQTSFKVWGNCEMCQETIEGSLKTSGVGSASWDTESKILSIQYDSTIINLDQIHKRVAASGYDTERYRADVEVYENLNKCCQYERRP